MRMRKIFKSEHLGMGIYRDYSDRNFMLEENALRYLNCG